MIKALQVLLLLILCGLAISPVVIAPGIAESWRYDRSTGSTAGAFVGMAAFALMGWVSIGIIRRRQNRKIRDTVNHALDPYRDDEDKGNT